MPTIAIREAKVTFDEFNYRTPMKFRGTVLNRTTILNVEVHVEAEAGRLVSGLGSMTLGNAWSFPSTLLSFDQTLEAMKRLAADIARVTGLYRGHAHPIEINHQLEPICLAQAGAISLVEPIPKLCTLAVASAFDAAIHDAYGKALKLNCYKTYGPAHMANDLSRYLDDRFRGEYIDRYLLAQPAESLYVYHLVGALDPLVADDLKMPLNDGSPETLEDWVRTEGVNHLKIKLDGNNLAWDVDRILTVDRVLTAIEKSAHYSLDFNERCSDAEYVLECFARVKEAAPQALNRIEYVEQPAHRDLNAADSPDMHAVAKLKPVVIDESLVDYESLLRARELGYSGIALKACKGQSNALLMAAAAQKFGMFVCVQDLTCTGAALLQSVGLAAHLPNISAVENNGRQYAPIANEAWKRDFPGIFQIRNGVMQTGSLTRVGLGTSARL